MVVFGKVVVFGQAGCIRAKLLYSGKTGCNQANWLYLGIVVVFDKSCFVRENF